MPFNKEQQQAIDSKVDENVLISAGAGSGKTKTLSSKVYKVCAMDGIKPSQLLVLTFTNKAAFEMKERIIAQFREAGGDNDALTDEILSSHIQTFDSFSLYLVQQYSTILNVPSTISIMDDNILTAKANEFLDDIFKEHYEKKDSRFQSLIEKFNMANDASTKRVVLDLEKKLKNLLPSEKEDFVRHYDQKFLSNDFLLKRKEEYLTSLKKKLILGLKKAVLLFQNGDPNLDIDAVIENLKHIDYSCSDYRNFSFGEEKLDKLYQLALYCLDASEDNLMEMVRSHTSLDKDIQDLWNARGYPAGVEDGPIKELLKQCFNVVRSAFRDDFLMVLKKLGPFDKQIETILSFKEDIHLLFDLVEELDVRLEKYKFLSNAYSFQDISNMALALLIDPKYKEAGESIKSRFRYVLVDEYQDTNDFQEAFLNAISQKATLFTVGDAKQAIYGFRNSNCQLFLDRKALYERTTDGKHTVIDMNKNYRSVEKILSDVNAIFENYMSKEHGGILYTDMERLDYDKKADVYALARENKKGEYGIHILDYKDEEEGCGKVDAECLTIIKDIKEKVSNGYPVLDFIDGKLALRQCHYRDFAILIRKRSHFDIYQKLFLDNAVPLNNEIETGFGDIDAILTIQSLVRLLSWRMGKSEENVRHLYLSVARSYLYGKKEGYDDKTIYKTLTDDLLWKKDRILKDIDTFIEKEKDLPFSRIFLDMLESFGVIKKLPELGDVSNNVSKIESYYQLLVGQENVGEGLSDFVSLFKSIDKYKIGISASSVTSLEDAVSLMTIHQSKGLEFKLVYMPLCDNAMASGNNRTKPDYLFTRSYGLLLPDYGYNHPIDTFLTNVYLETEGSKSGEISEHVRLFYVALTRPKETLYLVGRKTDVSSKSKENLMDMLDFTFHYDGISQELYDRFQSLFDVGTKGEYHRLIQLSASQAKERQDLLNAFDDEDERSLATFLFDTLVMERTRKAISDCIESFSLAIYDSLVEDISADGKKAIQLLVHYYSGLSVKDDLDSFLKENGDSLSRLALATDKKTLLKQAQAFLSALEEAKPNDFIKAHLAYQDPKLLVKGKNGASEEKNLIYRKKRAVVAFLPSLLFVGLGRATPLVETFYPLFSRRTVSLKGDEKGQLSTYKLPSLKVDESEIAYPQREKRRASKFLSDEESPQAELLERGTLLHRYLEVVDFKSKALPEGIFSSPKDRNIIQKVLSLPLFEDLSKARIYKEYPYYDNVLKSQGIIDLLIVHEDHIDIVDYKLKNIDDEAYKEQLKTYRRNILSLFGKERKVHTYLLSILEHRLEEIPAEEDD